MYLDYYPSFLTKDEYSRLWSYFEALYKQGQFTQEGKHDSPRFVYSESSPAGINYVYSNRNHVGKPMNPVLYSVLNRVNSIGSENMSHVLVTVYLNGEREIPYHSDDEEGLLPKSSIGTVSLGDDRLLGVKLTHPDIKLPPPPVFFKLEGGSLNFMKGDFQSMAKHSILKKTGGIRPRLSLTFRNVNQTKVDILIDTQYSSVWEVHPFVVKYIKHIAEEIFCQITQDVG